MSVLLSFVGAIPFLLVSSAFPPVQAVAEAREIGNWPAPPYWTPPFTRATRGARTDAVSVASPPLPFIAVTACRVADTRGNGFTGQYGPPALFGGATRSFTIAGQCGIPATAAAVSFNFTASNVGAAGDLRVFPAGGELPPSSTLNYSASTPNIANAAVVPLGAGGAITVQADVASIDLVIDVNGYYDGSGTLQLSLSRRAALDQFWTPRNAGVLGLTTVGIQPYGVRSDGADVWVANARFGTVTRVRGSDGRVLETWTGAPYAIAVLVAMGKVFVVGPVDTLPQSPGVLYQIDPAQPAGPVTTVATGLGASPQAIAFDGARIWTANGGGSVSIVTPSAALPWPVTTVTTGFSRLEGVLYDGTNIWVTDYLANTLLKLDSSGAILQTVPVGSQPYYPAFDGANIWVPNFASSSVSVVRASDGAVLATLTGNGLVHPIAAAFDGQRVLMVNTFASLWKAADLKPLGSFSIGTESFGVCSDGVNFWLTIFESHQLARF